MALVGSKRQPLESADTLEAAVARAQALSQPEVVIASACASFDTFRSYAHRGDVIQAAVRNLRGDS